MVFPNQEQSNINSWTSQKWLSSQTDFTKPNVTSKSFGISSFSYMIANAWKMVPNDMKNVNASLLSLQAMSKLCFLWRFRQHILNHCNAPFVGKLGSCFFTSEVCGGRLWGSEVLSKNVPHRPVSLSVISLFCGCFSYILQVETGYGTWFLCI